MEEWLTTVQAAALWEQIVGGMPTAFQIPSGNRFQRMARGGELDRFGIRVQVFAGRYAIEKLSLLEYVWHVCACTLVRISEEAGPEWSAAHRDELHALLFRE